MKKISLLICFVINVFVFSTEPRVEEEYYIHTDNRILYIGMTVEEVLALLGEPEEIKVTRRNDPLHNLDIVTWIYSEIEIAFYDTSAKSGSYSSNTVTLIIIPNRESRFKIGDISPHNKTQEEITAIFGTPDHIIESDRQCIYYQYDLFPFELLFNTYVLQFRFNDKGICDELVFIEI